MTGLYTIGYEGADLGDFLATLRAMCVTTLVDVRELPISRRKGFSKAALGEALGAVDIAYKHERHLGSPAMSVTACGKQETWRLSSSSMKPTLRSRPPCSTSWRQACVAMSL